MNTTSMVIIGGIFVARVGWHLIWPRIRSSRGGGAE
jgi:hypothetical protein